MAKKSVAVSSGVDGLISALEGMDEVVDMAVDAGLVAMGEQGKRDLQRSYLTMIPNAKQGDYVYTSLDSHAFTSDKAAKPWVSVGSYEYTRNTPNIRLAFGKTKSDMLPSQVAYWMEHGTKRLVSGARKPKGVSWSDVSDELQSVGMPARPFISNAATSGWTNQEAAFAEAFNNKITLEV